MSGFATEADAAAAYLGAIEADAGVDAPLPPPATEPAAPVVETAPVVDAGTTDSDSFTNIDINSFPEELRPQLEEARKNFQADYTRKTQEIAPIRQLMEQSGLSLEEAQQAIEFVKGLSDPTNAQALYEHLQTTFGETEPAEEDLNVDPRDRQIEQLSSRLETWEQKQMLTEAQVELSNAQQAVRAAHADFGDADLTRVEQLAVAHMSGGKNIATALADAATEYAAMREEIVTKYIEGKGKAQAGGTPLGETSHAQTPTKFDNLEDATKAALTAYGQDWVN